MMGVLCSQTAKLDVVSKCSGLIESNNNNLIFCPSNLYCSKLKKLCFMIEIMQLVHFH